MQPFYAFRWRDVQSGSLPRRGDRAGVDRRARRRRRQARQVPRAPRRAGSRARAAAALERGKVFLNEREVTLADAADAARRPATSCGCGWIVPAAPAPARRSATIAICAIVYEDDALIVLDKPAGPARGAAAAAATLRRAVGVRGPRRSTFAPRATRRPFVVHRIDRDTSGLVLFAKSEPAQDALKEQFKRHEPERVYRAVVYGHPVAARRARGAITSSGTRRR